MLFRFADSSRDLRSKKEEKFPENAVEIDSPVLLDELKNDVAILLTSAPAIIPVATSTGRKKIVLAAPLPINFWLRTLAMKKLKNSITTRSTSVPRMAL